MPIPDLDVESDELDSMQRIVPQIGRILEDQAALVAEMAVHRSELLGVTENYLATYEVKTVSVEGNEERLRHCLLAAAAADDSISSVEEDVLQVATELGLKDSAFIRIRAGFREERAVLKGLPGTYS